MTQAIGSLADSILANIVRDKKFVRDNPRDWADKGSYLKAKIAETLTLCGVKGEDTYHKLKDLCESPIECLAFAALLSRFPAANVVRKKEDLKLDPEWSSAIIPQMPHANYRLDFAIIRRDNRKIYSLECDGYDYHLTKRRDIDRAVNLWNAGVLVHRLSGSALYRNPGEAIDPLVRRFWEGS